MNNINIPATLIGDDFLSFTFTDTGEGEIIQKHDSRYEDVKQLITNRDWAGLKDYFDVGEKVKTFSKDNMQIVDGVVYYKGESVHHVICDKVIHFMKEGLPFDNLLKFLENLLECDSYVVLNELYLFLSSNESMPITEDGAFLAYRVVAHNYMSKHPNPDGSYNSNKIGEIVTQKRNQVNPDRHQTCSNGLHFCSKSYIPKYGSDSAGDRVMIVKIFPEDVVTIPSDYNNSKGRCCKYEVVAELTDYFTAPKPLDKPYYPTRTWCSFDEDGEDDYEDDYEDEDEDDYEDDYEDDDYDDDYDYPSFQSYPTSKKTTSEYDNVIKIATLQIERDGETTIRKISKSTKPYVNCTSVFDTLAEEMGFMIIEREPISTSVVTRTV